MALVEPNITFVNLSTSGKEITLQDKTPTYGDNVITGATLVVDSPFKTSKESTLSFDSTTIPNISQVTGGITFKVSSVILGDSTAQQGLYTFRDGVLQMNYYPYVATRTGTGLKGTHYITGTGLIDILENYEAIVVGENVYHLDQSKPTNGGTVIYTVEEIKEDFTEFNPAFRGTVSILVDTSVKLAIAEGASALAYPHNRTNGLKEGVRKLIHNFNASRIWFELGNYSLCNRATKENYQIIDLYKLTGIC